MPGSSRRLPLAVALLLAGCASRVPPPAPTPAPPPVVILSPPPPLPVPVPASRPRRPVRQRPARPLAPKADTAAAARARAAGLAALAKGDLAAALPLFRRAAALDPADPLIRRDLARVENAASRRR